MRFENLQRPRFDWREFLLFWALGFVLPRYAYWSRWPGRLSGWRLVGYLALKVGQGMGVRYWVVPWLRRAGRQNAALRAEVREHLGHEPSEDEMFDYIQNSERA